jgi:hypothetical protein
VLAQDDPRKISLMMKGINQKDGREEESFDQVRSHADSSFIPTQPDSSIQQECLTLQSVI